ncbi:L-xylulose reductase [Penicillium diatomitis]|uniref:L-xylulose reductase n=1 Tax=Penicillium diatomitis TaxID=2819901 RepID=A0A9W9XEL9_9EURO|nr:L-xylulose reductase [Penicillium diatomitis]KAJ5489322.1 L-xylulose reductase [Penicillium diatomitis]
MQSSHIVLAATCLFFGVGTCSNRLVAVPSLPEDSEPVSRDLQSFSLEFAFFPDYAGNKSSPNLFSRNLLQNFKNITGVYPKVRVGGTSQDNSIFYPNQEEGVQLIFTHPNDDQPSQIHYGPAFFESYETLGDIQYIHGLNMKQNNSMQQLTDAAVAACRSMGSKLNSYELGNEFNMEAFKYRPANYTLQSYIDEWNSKTAAIMNAVKMSCPGTNPGFMAPSWVLAPMVKSENWTIEELFKSGFDPRNITRDISFHQYFGVFAPPLAPVSWDLQRTLMNHTNVVENVAPHIKRAQELAYLGHPYVLGETNAIANQGRNGETNVFGDALWLVDFSLWSAANNIKRLHFHQGLNYRYTSWQPILSKRNPPKTRPPYYGQIMVASAIGKGHDTRIVNIPLQGDRESAYAVFNGTQLSKLVVINLQAYNQSATLNRPSKDYRFKLPSHVKEAKVERLSAPGSDSTGSVTFGGVSYDYDLLEGNPVAVHELEGPVHVDHETVRISVPDSSAVLLTLLS